MTTFPRNGSARKGMAAIQSVMLIALGAIMLIGLGRYFSGERGVAGQTAGVVARLFAGGEATATWSGGVPGSGGIEVLPGRGTPPPRDSSTGASNAPSTALSESELARLDEKYGWIAESIKRELQKVASSPSWRERVGSLARGLGKTVASAGGTAVGASKRAAKWLGEVNWSEVLDATHTTLDVAGMIPGIGEFADLANAAIYLAEGDIPNALISGAGAIPIVGQAATGGRLAVKATTKGVDALKAAERAAELERAAARARATRGGALTLYDPVFAARQTLKSGTVHIDDLKRLVPTGTPNTFRPSSTIAEGSKFKYTVNGKNVEIKWHSPDANAAAMYPGSRSGSTWTAQIKVGKKLLGSDGRLYNKPSDLTHIPIHF